MFLIVEDEPGVAEALAWRLGQEGWTTCHAPSVAAATARLEAGGITLAILDCGLRDGSGLDLLRAWAGRLPIIMLTARADEVDRVVGLELGADDYIAKPFSPREVVARIRAVLRRTQGAVQATTVAPAALPVLALDREALILRVHGRIVELTRMEFRLLAALADAPGRVLARGRLLDLVWDDPGAVVDRAVDSHIKSLRAKLRQAGAGDPIATVRGEGYRFSLESP